MKLEEFFNKTKIISSAIKEICETEREHSIFFYIDATKLGRNYTTESRKFISGSYTDFSELIEAIKNSDADQDVKETIIHTINTCDVTFKKEFHDDFTEIEGRLKKRRT